MITIRRIINLISILLLLLFSNCSSKKNIIKKKQNTQNDCIKVVNQNEIEINNFYNNIVKRNYLNFVDSKNEIDVILITTHYGYEVKQEVKRFYKNKEKILFLNNEKINKITQKKSNSLILFSKKINEDNVYINCPKVSSKQSIYELIVKKNGILSFSIYSNEDLLNISKHLASNEYNFIKEFIKLSR